MNGFITDFQLLKIDYFCTLSTVQSNPVSNFQITTKCCILCNTNFVNHYDYLDHINEHLNNFFYDRLKWLQISDKIVLDNKIIKYDEEVTSSRNNVYGLHNRFIVNVVQIHETTIECQVKNVYHRKIDIQHIFMYHPTNIILYIDEEKWPKLLEKDSKVNFFIHRNLFNQNNRKYPIYIHFTVDNLQNIEYWEFNVTKSLEVKRTKKLQDETAIKNIVNLREKALKLNNLRQYDPRPEIEKLYKQDFIGVNPISVKESKMLKLIEDLTTTKPNNLTSTNYLQALQLFADIEDICMGILIQAYNRKNEILEPCGPNYKINVPNLSESRPSILVYDRLTIHSPLLRKAITGIIWDIQRDHIVVQFKEKIDRTLHYDVNFMCNRTSLRMEKLAIELMEDKILTKFMFPIGLNVKNSLVEAEVENFEWYNISVGANAEQQIAVRNIYHGTAFPSPYILFGPPGTGKTTTLVESILQLWKRKPESRILIVSTSNFACNVISKRLLEFLPTSEILRLFSKSQEVAVSKIDNEVLEASNLDSLVHYYPPLPELYSYRIIVSTLTTSGRLIQGGFNSKLFTHLFIDECGSCTEGSSLVPIAGLISSKNTINANIVLAGDPLQLGPIVQSRFASNLGYDSSLIERLMKCPLYQKDEQTGKYNTNLIIKLRQNYRSHKDILHISNKMFYEDELIALGSVEATKWALNWKHLPNPKFPIIFHSVSGQTLRDQDSPSFYNNHEISKVMMYLSLLVDRKVVGKKITQKDIGVITPYRKQCQKIRRRCDQRKWDEIEVASVEAFQGNEKNVIILSTVRSNMKTLGFLNNERRLNVALTRAHGLLIIIGDPLVLKMDKHWREVIKYCRDNKAFVGKP